MFKYYSRTVAVALVLSFTAACATTVNPTFDEASITSEKPLSTYDKVFVAEVQTDLTTNVRRVRNRENTNRPVTEADQQKKADQLRNNIIRSMSKELLIDEVPSAGSLIVQTTITELASSRPTQGDFSFRPALNPTSVYSGGATVVIELYDGDVLLARLKESEFGDISDFDPRVGDWHDVDHAFPIIASKLTAFVQAN